MLTKGKNSDNAITYDQFVKEFLLKGHVKEISITEKGRVYVEIMEGEIGPISVMTRLRERSRPQVRGAGRIRAYFVPL